MAVQSSSRKENAVTNPSVDSNPNDDDSGGTVGIPGGQRGPRDDNEGKSVKDWRSGRGVV